MELTIQLEDNVDVSVLSRMLLQIKGVKSVAVSDEDKTVSWKEIDISENLGKVMETSENIYAQEDKTYSWEEIEKTEEFKKVIEQSRNQIKNGQFVEHSEELMDSIFHRK